jgi:hypothetical protein
MAKKKYYKTMHVYSVNEEFRQKYNIPSHVRQFSIACATTSLKKANDWAESLGIGSNVFRSNFTYALERPDLIEECEKHGGFVIQPHRVGEYTSIQEALREKKG